MTPDQMRSRFPSGIRFRISVFVLLAALNLTMLGTAILVLSPAFTDDPRPIHRGGVDAGNAVTAFHLHLMLDAQRAKDVGIVPSYPAAEAAHLREQVRAALPDDAAWIEPVLADLDEAARRWYAEGLPVPADHALGMPSRDSLAADAGPAAWDTSPGFGPPGLVLDDDDSSAPARVALDEIDEALAGASFTATSLATAQDDAAGVRAVELASLRLQLAIEDAVDAHLVARIERIRPYVGFGIAWIALMVGSFLFLSWRLRTMLSVPLGQLGSAAVALREGRLDVPVPIPRQRTELHTLARALDEMRTRVGEHLSELEQQNRRLTTILNVLHDGVLLIDGGGVVQQCNPAAARLLGHDPTGETSLVGRPAASLGIGGVGSPAAAATGAPTLEVPRVRPGDDGDGRYLRVLHEPLPGVARGASGHVTVVRDITREKEMEQLQNDFFSMVTHELKTPLTPIEGYTRLMLGGRPGPLTDDQRRFLEIITSQVQILRGMIQDLLDISRINAGRLSLAIESFEPWPMITRVVERFSPQASQQGLDLACAAVDERVRGQVAYGDEARLEQVFGNLIGNALKFTAAGRIDVALVVEQRHWWIEVQDTGKGIPAHALPRVFEKFYQVEQGDTRSAGGAGLGLYICREIVEAHGGRIDVRSAVGVGSTFRVVVPVDGPPDDAPDTDGSDG